METVKAGCKAKQVVNNIIRAKVSSLCIHTANINWVPTMCWALGILNIHSSEKNPVFVFKKFSVDHSL